MAPAPPNYITERMVKVADKVAHSGKVVNLLNLTKEEAGCIATVVRSVLDLGLLKKAPSDIEIDIKNGLTKLIHYAGEKYPV